MSAKEFKEVVKEYYATNEIHLRDMILTYVIFRTRWLLSERHFYITLTKADVLHDVVVKVLQVLQGKIFRKATHPCNYMNMVIEHAICDCVRLEIKDNERMDKSVFVEDFCDIEIKYLPAKFIGKLSTKIHGYKPINYFGKQYNDVIQDIVSIMKEKPYFAMKGKFKCSDYGIPNTTIVFLSRFYRREMFEYMKGYYVENKNS